MVETVYFFCVYICSELGCSHPAGVTLFAPSRNIFFPIECVTDQNNDIRNNHLSIFGTRLSNIQINFISITAVNIKQRRALFVAHRLLAQVGTI